MKFLRWFTRFVFIFLLVMVLSACSTGAGEPVTWAGFTEAVMGFFDGFTAEALIGLVVSALFSLIPNFGVAFFNFIKKAFKVEDIWAYRVIMVFAFVISAVALLVTGGLHLAGLDFTLTNVLAVWGVILALATDTYKRLQPTV